MMKIDRFETHDRYAHFLKEQDVNIAKGAEDCLKRNDLSLALQEKSPYIYIFAHSRTSDDGSGKRMLWQPRLSRPHPQTNSYLFRARSKTDEIEVCWIIPPREMWGQYKKGNVTESEVVNWSIAQFTENKKQLGMPDPDDLPEERGRQILAQVITEHMQRLKDKKTKNPSKLII